ncbi:MAG: DMT family transporter [Betaproteobacteria bacterium]|nr:DMT family transporter [Betaproteobacteria bacterium]
MPSDVPTNTKSHWWSSPYLLLTLTSLFWSLNWVIGRAVVGKVPPIALAYWRWVIAVLIMLPFAIPQIRRSWPLIWKHRGVIALLALVGTGFHNMVSYIGLQYTTATNGVMLNSAIPVLIVLLGVLFFRQRVVATQVIGVAISLTGVLAIMCKGHLETLGTLQFNIGDLIVLGSMLLWALYTLMLKWRPDGIPPIAFLCVCGIIGVAAMTPVYVWDAAHGMTIEWSWPVVGALIYLGLFPSFIGYIFWNKGVEQLGANVSGLFVHLMPVFGSLLSWLFLDERLYWFHFAGIALILAGIFLTTWFARQPVLPAGEE